MRWSFILFAIACTSGEGGDDVNDDAAPTGGTPSSLSATGVIDDDHSTIVHVTWSTPTAFAV
jgi:hypothetical protein